MNCRYIENNLLGYIEKSLSESDLLRFSAHLDKCETCMRLENDVRETYLILENKSIRVPQLLPGIESKMQKHHTAVVEFVPQHKLLFRIAASFLIIVGTGLGVFVGDKYTNNQLTDSQNANQTETIDYYSVDSNPMDGESGLDILYTNE